MKKSRFIEEQITYALRQDDDMISRIYILSTGRSGTTFLHNILQNASPEVDIQHQGRISRILNILGNLFVNQKNGYVYLKYAFQLFRGSSVPRSTLDPLLSIPLTVLLRAERAPLCKVIHLVRDPRNFVTSFMNWRVQKKRRLVLHHMIPLWQPSPWLHGGYGLGERLQMSKFEHFCWIWNYKNSLFRDTFASHDGYYLVRMEDLVDSSDGRSNIQQLLLFIGFVVPGECLDELVGEKINKSETSKFPAWTQWTNEEVLILNRHCGRLMKELGYGQEPAWQRMIGESEAASARVR